MITAIQRIDYYFGLVGVASIGVWMAALILAALFVIRVRLSKIVWAALVLGVADFLASRIHRLRVRQVKVHYSEGVG